MCNTFKHNQLIFLENLLCELFPNLDYNIKPATLINFDYSDTQAFYTISGNDFLNLQNSFCRKITNFSHSGYLINFKRPLTASEQLLIPYTTIE